MTVRTLCCSILVSALTLGCASNDRPPELQNTSMMGVDEHRQATSGDTYEIMEYVRPGQR